MHKGSFYRKIACINIKNNYKFYMPYILTGMGTVMMLYIMLFITNNPKLPEMFGGNQLEVFLQFGSVIIGIFSLIILFYTNSFLMKRRKKELGLFHLLGMEKRHLARVQLVEKFLVAAISIIGGLTCGILFSKLVLLFLGKLVHFTVPFGFSISSISILMTVMLFCGIYLLTLIYNLIQIGRAKPIDLLKSGQVGQKEPKSKLLLVIIGVLSLGGGYAIALLTQSPLDAIFLFFIAVILVIIGTYCLFTAGSIFILKLLRKNKRYYYRTNHFASISGMLYRMKQNAVGLANICILSTMVLVMVSTTVALYAGMEDILKESYPHEITLSIDDIGEGETKNLAEEINEIISEQKARVDYLEYYDIYSYTIAIDENGIKSDVNSYTSNNNFAELFFITELEYQRLTGKAIALDDNEVISYSSRGEVGDTFTLLDEDYTVIERLDEYPIPHDFNSRFMAVYGFVVNDATFNSVIENKNKNYDDYISYPVGKIVIDLEGSKEEKISCYQAIKEVADKPVTKGDVTYSTALVVSREASRADLYAMYGGFLFLGIFLGLLFLMATILIIYYKQITEGYEDKDRFKIMQKVGMSEAEVKKSIRSQILTVFFLPLVTACVHIIFAFPIIVKLLAVLQLTNVSLFVWCTIASIAVFAIVYTIVYAVTSRIYYQIVG